MYLASIARYTSKYRGRRWGQGWLLHMPICSWTDLKGHFLAQEPILPLVWKRYIDDILCIWTGTRSELDSFLDRLNKAHRTLRFTWSISDKHHSSFSSNIRTQMEFRLIYVNGHNTEVRVSGPVYTLRAANSHKRPGDGEHTWCIV